MTLRADAMGLFASTKTSSNIKLINKYIKERIKQKQVLNNQLEKLAKQLQSATIDQYMYERLRAVLEINYMKQRNEALEKTIFRK